MHRFNLFEPKFYTMSNQREIDRQRELEDLLASDDEYPSTYNEKPDIPAYLMPSRFEPIKFSWIRDFTKVLEIKNTTRIEYKSLYNELNVRTVYNKIKQLEENEEVLLTRGVISELDLFCLKCITPVSDVATTLWFINFLMYKDLNSKCNFLKSCLVSKYNTKICYLDEIKTDNKDSDIVIVIK